MKREPRGFSEGSQELAGGFISSEGKLNRSILAIWQFLTTFCQFDHFLAIFTILGQFWPFLDKNYHFSSILTILGNVLTKMDIWLFRLSRRIRREHIGPPLQPRIAISPASKPIEVIVTKPSNELTNNNAISPNIEKQKARVHLLEKQVQHQQTEITGLRDVVDDLRSSLQLSDAQNLALQVLLKKMAKGKSF